MPLVEILLTLIVLIMPMPRLIAKNMLRAVKMVAS